MIFKVTGALLLLFTGLSLLGVTAISAPVIGVVAFIAGIALIAGV